MLTVTALASSLPTARTGSVSIQFGGGTQRHHGKSGSRAVFHDAATCFGDASRVRRNQQLWRADIVHLGRYQQCALDLGNATGSSGGSTSTGPPTVSGTGNGTVTYTAAANPCVASQSGTIIVTSQPNQTFTVTENGSPNNLTLSPASLNAPQAGTSGHLNVITGDPCAWSAFSDVGFIHINTTATGTGNGGLGYTIDANPGAPRNGNIHVGAQLFAVAQAGVTIPTVQLTTLNNAASYASGAVAPGEIVYAIRKQYWAIAGRRSAIHFPEQTIDHHFAGRQCRFFSTGTRRR